jgi:chitin synthase
MDNVPPPPSDTVSSRGTNQYGDPFADNPRQTHFAEPNFDAPSSARPPMPQATFASGPQHRAAFLKDDPYGDDEYEKRPLTSGQPGFAGGFYPPG